MEGDPMLGSKRREARRAERQAFWEAHAAKLEAQELAERTVECHGVGTFTYGGSVNWQTGKRKGQRTIHGPERSESCHLTGLGTWPETPKWKKHIVPPEGWEPFWPRCPECEALAQHLKGQDKARRAEEKKAKEAAKQLRQEAMRRTHSHIRRVRESGAPGHHSTAEWLLKLEEFSHKCAYCDQSGHDFHRDHLVPLAAGGSNDIANIVPACAPCNLSKGARSGAELLRWIAERRTAASRAA
jgi:5-methylcytosine-specific restriction endonuclease McrA